MKTIYIYACFLFWLYRFGEIDSFKVGWPTMPNQPTHRVRSKSAPRGKSPDPKALLKAAKSSNSGTPPPMVSGKKERKVRRRLSFGSNTIHTIQAENNVKPRTTMKDREADDIIAHMKELLHVHVYML